MRKAHQAVPVPAPPANCVVAAAAVAPGIFASAAAVDAAAIYPSGAVAALFDQGLLDAPIVGFASTAMLRETLTMIGSASLTVGRLYEGHVNAAHLIRHYGGAAAMRILAGEAAVGRPLGVWNAERGSGLTARRCSEGWTLHGRKIHCSGSGSVMRPIVTARPEGEEAPLMLMPDLVDSRVTIDLRVWQAAGMRGTATGTVTFDTVFVPDSAVVGGPGDYYRSPLFSGGAWRVLAVQLGGLDRIMALHAERLNASGRSSDPMVRARFANAAAAHEAARLSVTEAALRAEGKGGDPAAIDAYVDLARGGFETLALGCIEATRRNVGLGSFIAPDPLDRCLRDLETYLRQPFLDASRDNAAAWLLATGGRFP